MVDMRFLRGGVFKDEAVVRITILNADEPPHFTRIRYTLNITENCRAPCSVGRVHAVDPDTGHSTNIEYTYTQTHTHILFRLCHYLLLSAIYSSFISCLSLSGTLLPLRLTPGLCFVSPLLVASFPPLKCWIESVNSGTTLPSLLLREVLHNYVHLNNTWSNI